MVESRRLIVNWIRPRRIVKAHPLPPVVETRLGVGVDCPLPLLEYVPVPRLLREKTLHQHPHHLHQLVSPVTMYNFTK